MEAARIKQVQCTKKTQKEPQNQPLNRRNTLNCCEETQQIIWRAERWQIKNWRAQQLNIIISSGFIACISSSLVIHLQVVTRGLQFRNNNILSALQLTVRAEGEREEKQCSVYMAKPRIKTQIMEINKRTFNYFTTSWVVGIHIRCLVALSVALTCS